MIESVFGILSMSKNYFLTKQQFEFAVKYVLDTKYDIEPGLLEVRIDYIQNKIVLVFNEEDRDSIFQKIINMPFSFRNERKVKEKLLKDIFGEGFILEKVVYNELANSKVEGITFSVKENEKYFESKTQNMEIADRPQVEKINAQIRILTDKKIDVIRNNKR